MRIHPEGTAFIIGSALLTLLSYIINQNLGNLFLLTTLFVVYFFRNPKRIMPDDENLMVSPADGIIIDISEDKAPQEDETYQRISIFLRVWDVHVIRIPFKGKVTKKEHKRGSFAHAETKKALENNENLSLKIEGKAIYHVRQVAGMIARRIVCYCENGDSVKTGERYGIIKFGSRVDLYLPKNVKIFVKKGQTMVGGETVIGKVLDQ